VQFAHLTQMQAELDAAGPAVPITILGVNFAGAETGTPAVTASSDLPLLQDTVTEDVWTLWTAGDKDIFILGASNEEVTAYNAGANDLGVPANFEALKQLLLDTAAAQ